MSPRRWALKKTTAASARELLSLSLYDPAAFAEKDGPEDGSKKDDRSRIKIDFKLSCNFFVNRRFAFRECLVTPLSACPAAVSGGVPPNLHRATEPREQRPNQKHSPYHASPPLPLPGISWV